MYNDTVNQEPVDQEPVDQEPVVQEPVDQETVAKDTYKYSTIRHMVNQSRAGLNQLVDRLEALVGYMEICYASDDDPVPFGPDTLFHLKWCREYHLQTATESCDQHEAVDEIYQEYRECANVIIRAFSAAYRISEPDDYSPDCPVTEHVFHISDRTSNETWFANDDYYRIMEHMYYKTINVRDELDFRVLGTISSPCP